MNERINILILEDERTDAQLMERELRKAKIEFVSKLVDNERTYLTALKEFNPDLILADYSLPSYDGRSAMIAVRENSPHIPFIFVSGFIGEEMAVELLKEGATDYVLKNRLSRLAPTVRRAMEEATQRRQRQLAEEALRESESRYRSLVETSPDAICVYDQNGTVVVANLQTAILYGSNDVKDILGRHIMEFLVPEDHQRAQKNAQRALAGEKLTNVEYTFVREDGSLMFGETNSSAIDAANGDGKEVLINIRDITERKQADENLRQSLQKLRRITEGIVQIVDRAVATRDPYTAGHERNVAKLASAIAKEMNLSQELTECIEVASSIHDLGKLYVPSEILSKPGHLDELEIELLRMHVRAGYEILKGIEFPWPVAEIILQHHERLDGSGYPQGLKDGGISLEARIIGVSDVVEAMAAHRPYRPSLGIDKALAEISSNKGILYDFEIVESCINLFRSNRFSFE